MMTNRFHFRKKLLFPLVLGALTVLSLGASACNHHGHSPDEKATWILSRVSGYLDLTDVQKAKLDAVKQEFLAGHAEMKKDRAQAMDDFIAQVRSDHMDPAKLQDLFNGRKAVFEKAAPRVFAKLAEFHDSLDAKQKQKILEKLERFKKHASES